MKYSVIIPAHNEALNLPSLIDEVYAVMPALQEPYELIVVDDDSTDGTRAALEAVNAPAGTFTALFLKRRSGQSAALTAGWEAARGSVLITLDGDGQNDPRDIPALLKKMREGYDVVCGRRFERRDTAAKRFASSVANGFRRLITRDAVHDVGCSLRAMKREAVSGLRLAPGMHRFFTALTAKRGYRLGETKVAHRARTLGVSKYGVWDRLVQSFFDVFRVAFSPYERLNAKGVVYEIKETFRK